MRPTLDPRFVEHSVDSAERQGLPRTNCSRALTAFADQLSTLENYDVFLHRAEVLVALGQRRHRLLGSQHFSLGRMGVTVSMWYPSRGGCG